MENENFEKEQQKKWYQKTWGIIVLFIIFPPIGLYFLWKSDDYSQKTKSIVTSIVVFLIIASIFQNDGIDYANDKEIFVGKDSNGSSYYLLTDSIDPIAGIDNEGAYSSCRIKIVQSNNDIRYLECNFYDKTKYKPARFRDAYGNFGVINENDNSIASNTYIAINKNMEETIKQAKKSGK